MYPRKQVTYAHKRNRSKPSRIVSASSPIHEVDDADHSISPRLLKRARRSSNPEVFSSKKLRPSVATPAGSPSQYETPHPSALTEEQKFKLNSSRGLTMHPDQFSPLPVSRPVISGSSRLKENDSRRISKKDMSLHSPFNSRPNSARSSPQKRALTTEQRTQKPVKRTLSDTNYNPNIPQSASTTNSPAHTYPPIRIRRPSAPSPPRPGAWSQKENSFNFDFSALETPFFLPSATNDIDFNRPPSSLSFYGDSDAPLFDDVQAVSTPPPMKRTYTLGSDIDDEDDEFDREPDLTITQDAMDVDYPFGLKSIPTRERSPWLSDSLISPPASQDWNRHRQEGAYAHSEPDVDMQDGISLGLGLGPAPFVPGGEDEDPVIRAEGATTGDGELKQMFDGLALATKTRFLNNRTRSLDSPADNTASKPKGRDRRGTIRASDFSRSATAPTTRRTRSGTVIGPAAPAQHVGGINTPDAESIGEVSEEEELSGWCADGWAVAAPPSPVFTRKQLWTARDSALTHSPPSEGPTGSGLLPSPILKRKSRREREKEVVLEEDEEDDELLLKPGFNVWE
ncbi:hypothetical protein DFH07DRAFT_1063807 [Mycena maculata]|uniref:Uncharacterized protein n=1 Tax=Mycena maculata TaxID=230809 RepID=A0AAD7II44_9AGAR|nr:hypothetical protein DFH07DRAFT_1063807 [Mycena maculata]